MKSRVRSGLTLLVLALPVLLLSPSATAERMHGSPHGRGHHQFNKVPGHISGFNKHNHAALRGGHFVHGHRHGHHHGHLGRGWVNGRLWYGYPATVYPYPYLYRYPYPYSYPYPYPYPYSSSYSAVYPYQPPPAVTSPPIYMGPAMQYWSFCEASGAYYPNVTTCPGGWKQVQFPLNGTSTGQQ